MARLLTETNRGASKNTDGAATAKPHVEPAKAAARMNENREKYRGTVKTPHV
jgi:hypothetical protein